MSQDDVKTRILAAASLSDLIGSTVTLKKVGTRKVGLCPFHAEKSPSFYVFDDHYYCFGCKETGDAITFVRKTQGLSFVEALRHLAEKFRVPHDPSELGIRTSQAPSKTAIYYQILGNARKAFSDELQSPRGNDAREYLKERHFSPQQIKDLGFGLTPSEAWGLCANLRKLGYKESDMAEVSLVSNSDRGGKPYDFFRNRIMIPIEDLQGRTIAFGGRTLNANDPAKYKNSAQHPLFDKSKVLFHLSRAKEEVRKKKRLIIVEGYMDALQLFIHGFPETVAVMGTALTEHHLKVIKNFTSDVVLLFDGDAAGERASFKALDLVMGVANLNVRVAVLPKGYDPDAFVIEKGEEALEEILNDKARDILDFVMSSKVKSVTASALPALIEQEFIPWLSQVEDPLRRGFLVTKMSEWSGVKKETIEGKIHSKLRIFSGARKENILEAQKEPEKKATSKQAEFLALLFFHRMSPQEIEQADNLLEEEFSGQLHLALFGSECIAYQKDGVLPSSLGIGSYPSLAAAKGATIFTWLQSKKDFFEGIDLKKTFAALMASFAAEKRRERLALLKQELKSVVVEEPEVKQQLLREIALLLRE